MIEVEKIDVTINNIESHITNTYLIYDEDKNCIIIDPGDEAEKIISKINDLNLKVFDVIITHAHADHIGALEEIFIKYNCRILINEYDYDLLFDNENNCAKLLNDMKINLYDIDRNLVIKIKDNEELTVGKMNFRFIHTPGHTKGSMCIYETSTKYLFTGDTIFSKYFGRCDLFSASIYDMTNSLKRIFNNYSDETLIFCGHGENAKLESSKKKIKILLAIKYGIEI